MALMIADSVLVSAVYAVRRSAGCVQQLLQSGALALEALEVLQIGGRGQRHAPHELQSVHVSGE